MSQVDAVYRRGVFEPLEPVHLAEQQRVRLSIEPTDERSPESWLSQLRQLQAAVVQRQGYLPDSAAEIAADRTR